MDQQKKNYRVRYMSWVTSKYEKSLNRWDGEIMIDNERWIMGLEFKKNTNYYYLSWVELWAEPIPTQTQLI
jgi:hypothetical protein